MRRSRTRSMYYGEELRTRRSDRTYGRYVCLRPLRIRLPLSRQYQFAKRGRDDDVGEATGLRSPQTGGPNTAMPRLPLYKYVQRGVSAQPFRPFSRRRKGSQLPLRRLPQILQSHRTPLPIHGRRTCRGPSPRKYYGRNKAVVKDFLPNYLKVIKFAL